MANLRYCGLLENTVYLSAFGFSVSFTNIVGFSSVNGFLGALDSLGSQAFGASNYKLLANCFFKMVITALVISFI